MHTWFIFSFLFFFHKEDSKSGCTRGWGGGTNGVLELVLCIIGLFIQTHSLHECVCLSLLDCASLHLLMCPLSCIHNVHNKLFGGPLSSKVLCSSMSVGVRKLTTIEDTAGSRSAQEMK